MKKISLINPTYSVLALAVASAFVLTACGGNGGVQEYAPPAKFKQPLASTPTPTAPGSNTSAPKPAAPVFVPVVIDVPKPHEPEPEPEPTPVTPIDSEPKPGLPPLPAANKATPEAGYFLPPDTQYNEHYTPIVRLHHSMIDGQRENRIEYGVKLVEGRNGVFFAGLRKVTYDQNGKPEAFYVGSLRPFGHLALKVGDQIEKATEYKIRDMRDAIDAGLKAGGQYAGVYTNNAAPAFFFRDPAVANWNYQTYGSFQNTGNIETDDMYQSIGQLTPGANVPTQGSAEYKGIASGTKHGSELGLITADVTVKANFGSRQLDFATSNTKTYAFENNTPTAADNLDLSGTARWNSGSNNFRGDIKTADDAMSGRVNGRFYGPNVDEVGGVFGVSNEDKSQNYLGGFGARRE